MYDDFIAFEPGTKQPSSQQVPGLLFVNCDQHSGRTQENVKRRVRQHVMRTHLHHDRKSKAAAKGKSKPLSVSGSLDDPLAEVPDRSTCPPPLRPIISSSYRHALTPNDVTADATDVYVGDPRAILGGSLGMLSLPFETDYDAKTVLRWMAAGHDSMQADKFKTASTFHLHGLWQWASTHKLAFDGLALYMCRKRLELEGDSVSCRREFLQRRGNLIEAIRHEIIKIEKSTDSGILFAIVCLASSLILENELRASAVHIVALRSMCNIEQSSFVSWTYLWMVILRLALLTGKRPIVDYKIPHEFKESHSQHTPEMFVRPDAMLLAMLSPKAKTAFAPPRTEELFSKLLRLCSISGNLGATADPPLCELLQIEYDVRRVHACILNDPPSPTRLSIELTILAVQLSVWIAARLFAPLTEQSASSVLHRAKQLLASVSPLELLHAWTNSAQADPVSLLWVLALLTSCLAAGNDELVPLPGLAYVTNHLSITTEREFLNELQRWPPQKAWNESRYSRIWSELVKFEYESPNIKMSQTRSKGLIAPGEQGVSRPKRPFFGALEFWDI